MTNLPYAGATSGRKARDEITQILRRFGCKSVGFMDEFETRSLLLVFTTHGRQVQLRVSAQGWANAWLRENPWTTRRRLSKQEWETRAINQGMIAVNSILRDWVKGQVTAVETGILIFDHIFFPYMLAADGRPMIDHVRNLLEAPREPPEDE